jgi:hypothetical protein
MNMGGKTKVLLAALVVVSALTASVAESGDEIAFDATTAFETLRKLDGEWEGTVKSPDGPAVSVEFAVTANDTTVMERLFKESPNEMINMYHMDGENLVLTHYCTLGNQPRMKFRRSETPGVIRFVFTGGGNMDPRRDLHMHTMMIRIVDSDHIETEWDMHADGKKVRTTGFVLERQAR